MRNKYRSLDVPGLCCGHKRVVGGSRADLRGRGRMEEENNVGPRFPTVMVWLFCKGFLEAEQKLEEVL